MRLGVFGGSFDPVHYGHLLLAETCREACRLDQVLFVPTAVPPHKRDRTLTDARQRVEMLQLAVAGHARFAVSTLEVDRGGVNYTADTLAAIAHERPQAELFFLMGADSLNDLPNWRQPERICELAVPVFVRRSGSPEPDLEMLQSLTTPQRLDQVREHQVEMPIIELSSTELRERVGQGRSIRFRTPRGVEQYILAQGLYRG